MSRAHSQSAQYTEWREPPPPLTSEQIAAWPMATCPACGYAFPQDSAFKKMCIPCFKASRGVPRAPIDDAHLWLQMSVRSLLRELNKLSKDKEALSAELADIEPPMPDDLLKDLIFFAHPDRNGGSERATRVTRALNAIRDARAK